METMSRHSFVLLALLAGCVAYEPAPIDWTKEAAALDKAPRSLLSQLFRFSSRVGVDNPCSM